MNQKNRASALKMLVTRRICSCSSVMPADDLRRRVGAVAEAHQRIGERAIGVHRHVAGDIVEDVRLGQVVEGRAVPDGDRGREFAVAEAVEEQEGGNVPAHRLGLEAGERAEKSVDVLEPRHPLGIETEVVDALQEPRIGVAVPAVVHAGEQPAPGVVVGLRVQLVRLIDVQPPLGLRLLDERRPRRRQTFARLALLRTPAMPLSSVAVAITGLEPTSACTATP